MKRFLCLLILLAGLLQANGQNTAIRKHLVTALKSSQTADSLYNVLNAQKHKSGLTIGYIATLQALKAVHAWNPYNKIKYLNRAERDYKQAVTLDPHNMEIRFMRFSVEHNVPGWLGYTKNLEDDRKMILQQLHKKNHLPADHDLVITVIKFMLESKRCTPEENEYLTHQLTALK